MPIRKELRKFYGKKWRKEIRPKIQARAGDRCEQCGVPNHTRVLRRGGYWRIGTRGWRDCLGNLTNLLPLPPSRNRIIQIICTVAHLNSVPGDDRAENLMFLCQWCHLSADRPMHLANSRTTRTKRKDAARPLLQEEAWK